MKQNEFWDKRSGKYDKNIKNESFYPNLIDKLKNLITENDYVLDFGCATGEISLEFSGTVKKIQGIDISNQMINLAKNKLEIKKIDNVEFIVGDLDYPDLLEAKYTKVLALNVLHLVNDVSLEIKKIHKPIK